LVGHDSTTVVNLHHGAAYDVRIDRTTIFGNPFRIGPDGDRGAVLDKYRAYFLNRVDSDSTFRQRVLELRNKRLACWCAPVLCHGMIIAEWLHNNSE
jgi:hypothetical protein